MMFAIALVVALGVSSWAIWRDRKATMGRED